MKLSVRPNYFKDFYVELNVSGMLPPLFASSFTILWFIPYVSIENIGLYLSCLEVVT